MQKGLGYIVISAVTWGMLPLFSRLLFASGFDPLTVAAMRAYITVGVFIVLALIKGLFKGISLRHLPFYAVYGVVTMGGTFIFYALSTSRLPIAMASMLLYTAPAFVILFSRIIYKEPITPIKLLALFLTFFGCLLVVRAYSPGSLCTDIVGIFFGLMSGLCFSTLSIFGRKGLMLYPSSVNTILPVIFASILMLFLRPPTAIQISSLSAWALFAGVAVVGSVIPYLYYLKGMELGVEGGTASITATLEPIVATLLGVVFLRDLVELPQIFGVLLVITGALLPYLLPFKSFFAPFRKTFKLRPFIFGRLLSLKRFI